MHQDLRRGLRDGLPIALGYFPVSFTFGILAVSGGLSFWQATLISLMNLTSAGQFAGLSVMTAGGPLVEMALSQLIINLRYSLMSISLSQKVDGSVRGLARWSFPFSVTDEIFAVSAARPEPVTQRYWAALRIMPIAGWTLGTLCGALLGAVLPQRLLEALGIALYAMFIAIIVPAARRDVHVCLACVLAVAFSCVFFFTPALSAVGSGFSVIICAVAASSAAAVLFPVGEEEGA